MSLTVALVLVLAMRRSSTTTLSDLAMRLRPSFGGSFRLREAGSEPAEPPRRMRPRLALDVPDPHPGETDEDADAPAPVEADDAAAQADAGLDPTPSGPVASSPVDAPGWPSPGELAVVADTEMDEADEVDQVDAETPQSEAPALPVWTITETPATAVPSTWDNWDQPIGFDAAHNVTPPLEPLPEWGDDADETPAADADGEPHRDASRWEWEARDAGEEPDDIEPSVWTTTASQTTPDPPTRRDRAIADAIRPLVEAADGPAPTIVVIVADEVRSTRDTDLRRSVRRIDKRLKALDASIGLLTSARADIVLTVPEERTLTALAERRAAPAATRRRARILLASARGMDVATVARTVGVHPSTVRRWQLRFRTDGLAGLDDPRGRRLDTDHAS